MAAAVSSLAHYRNYTPKGPEALAATCINDHSAGRARAALRSLTNGLWWVPAFVFAIATLLVGTGTWPILSGVAPTVSELARYSIQQLGVATLGLGLTTISTGSLALAVSLER